MLYIYRRKSSTGARELAEELLLGGTRARRTKGERLRTLQNGDGVVCWGDNFAVPAGLQIKTLNNVEPLSKFAEAQKLAIAAVPTVRVSRTKPVALVARPGVRPDYKGFTVGPLGEANVKQLIAQLQAHLQAPLPPGEPAETWLARRNNHVGGIDLLGELREGEYYSKKEDIVEEYRLHIFNGRSIRAGKKVKQATRPDGRTAPHAWIRSFDAGWNIVYDGFASTKEQRKLAASAVKALGLDFAAVDVAKLSNGKLIVLEVNRAPGVEGNTVATYAKKIAGWFAGVVEPVED
jgi:hypothetical protein